MEIRMSFTDFLCGVAVFCEEIEIGVGYAQCLLKNFLLPDELQDEIEEGIDKCMDLKEYYEDIYTDNVMTDGYEERVATAADGFEDNMLSFYLFLDGLDISLMQFGDGPQFLSNCFILPQYIEYWKEPGL